MNYLKQMYGKNSTSAESSNKNPNRVTGGLRAQGVDRFTMIAEDGSSQELPSLAYVRSLEEQSRKQRAALDILERKLARQEAAIENLSAVINRRS
jgi:hypothetical protein